MEHTSELIAAILAVLASLNVVLKAVRSSRDAEKERIAKEQEKVNQARARLRELYPELLRLREEISRLSDYDSGYLMKRDWDSLLASVAPIISAIKMLPSEVVEAGEYAEVIDYVVNRCQTPSFREDRNRGYKEHELKLCDALFSDIDGGKSLDPQQRDAVVTDEYSNLVIAGAGSGKTSVVVGKVKYLVKRWHVDPSEILVTSFTRASVDDLKARIEASGVSGVTARTFHSLGLRALGDVAVAQENALQRHVTSYLSRRLASHSDQAAAFLKFFGMWSLTPNGSPDSKEAEERVRILKAQDMRTLKGMVQESSHQGGMDTLPQHGRGRPDSRAAAR